MKRENSSRSTTVSMSFSRHQRRKRTLSPTSANSDLSEMVKMFSGDGEDLHDLAVAVSCVADRLDVSLGDVPTLAHDFDAKQVERQS